MINCYIFNKLNRILENLYFALIKSQAWVAFCFTLLCFYFQLINGNYNSSMLWIAFFATLVAYNFAYWFAEKSNLWRLPIIFISGCLCAYLAFKDLSITSWVLLGVLGIVSILYTLPIQTHTLRKIPGLKIFWIAIVWSFTLFLPWIEGEALLWWPMIWQSVSILCFVIGITIPYDIRDLKLDATELHTIPQVIGIERSIRLATQLLVLSAGFFLISVRFNINEISLSFLITTILAIALVRRSSNHNSNWYVSFWIEGLSTLPFALYFFIK